MKVRGNNYVNISENLKYAPVRNWSEVNMGSDNGFLSPGNKLQPGPISNLITLQWHHNERDGVSNNQPQHCLLNRLFRRRSKKTLNLIKALNIKAPLHWPLWGEFTGDRWIPRTKGQ